MQDLARAKAIRNAVRGYLGSPSSGLTAVPEIEREDLPGVARKLQVQVFALIDALVDTVAALDEAQRRFRALEAKVR